MTYLYFFIVDILSHRYGKCKTPRPSSCANLLYTNYLWRTRI